MVKGSKCKPCRLKQLLAENKCNIRNSHIISTEYQIIFDFWLSNSITSNECMCNIRKITKRSFLEQYPNITDPNLMEERKVLKNGSKQIFKVGRKIHAESVRKLHAKYSESFKPMSLTIFSKQNHFIATFQARERSRVVYALLLLIHTSC